MEGTLIPWAWQAKPAYLLTFRGEPLLAERPFSLAGVPPIGLGWAALWPHLRFPPIDPFLPDGPGLPHAGSDPGTIVLARERPVTR